MSLSFTTHSPAETICKAEKLGSILAAGDVITLEGDLGAGKTLFTKGLARALQITETVNSPTFTIIKEYHGTLPFYHMDLYRLGGEEAEEMGLEEYIESSGVCVIEWADRIEDILPPDHLKVTLDRLEGDDRMIRLSPQGKSFMERCKELENDEHTGD
ncbi:tRNA (adenosine(37)-N6)-threonylcarbamoyltransferase complex ATPase subunit type 1 TsaE [Salibacterium sp. K-3]